MKKNKWLTEFAVMAVITAMVILPLGGCTPAKKPLTPPAPAPRVEPTPTKQPAGTVEEKNGLNNKLSAAVNDVKGVERATVIVIGTSAYAGLDLEKNVDKASVEPIRTRVESVIKMTEPRIRTVWTATNPQTVAKIDRVRDAIRAGKPSSDYSVKLRDIINESDLVRHQG